MAYGTRNLLELKTKSHTLQVQLHLRTCDVAWFNQNIKDNIAKLMSLISKRILPVEFKEEIENFHFKGTNGAGGNGGGNNGNGNPKQNKPKANDKKRKAATKDIDMKKNGKITFQKAKIPSQKAKDSSITTKKDENKKTYLSTLDTKYVFGEDIQLTYRVKPVQNGHRATLLYAPSNESSRKKTPDSKTLSTFEYLQPLPKMIVIWCYPFDPLNPQEPAMDHADGFPRPEFIPVSALFKES